MKKKQEQAKNKNQKKLARRINKTKNKKLITGTPVLCGTWTPRCSRKKIKKKKVTPVICRHLDPTLFP
jgi:hypothetical protein